MAKLLNSCKEEEKHKVLTMIGNLLNYHLIKALLSSVWKKVKLTIIKKNISAPQ